LILITTVILTGILVVCAQPMVRILFERGSFTAKDTHVVSLVTAFFVLQIPFYVAGILGVRLLNALGMSRSILLICAANLVVNVLGNLLLMRRLGVAGIALTTSLVYLVSGAQVFFVIRRELNRRQQTATAHE
jgi:putative peptidoglycan lipid II flippase